LGNLGIHCGFAPRSGPRHHSAFDEVRDSLDESVGFGMLAENWQAVTLTFLGVLLSWKAQWQTCSSGGKALSVSGAKP
jgi:hypothetical protein